MEKTTNSARPEVERLKADLQMMVDEIACRIDWGRRRVRIEGMPKDLEATIDALDDLENQLGIVQESIDPSDDEDEEFSS